MRRPPTLARCTVETVSWRVGRYNLVYLPSTILQPTIVSLRCRLWLRLKWWLWVGVVRPRGRPEGWREHGWRKWRRRRRKLAYRIGTHGVCPRERAPQLVPRWCYSWPRIGHRYRFQWSRACWPGPRRKNGRRIGADAAWIAGGERRVAVRIIIVCSGVGGASRRALVQAFGQANAKTGHAGIGYEFEHGADPLSVSVGRDTPQHC
jgi:hypothetical protein